MSFEAVDCHTLTLAEMLCLFLSNFVGTSNEQRTDSDGEAHFDVESTDGKVYVDGSTQYEGRLAGRVVIYI